MINLVEMICDDDESGPSPCRHGNLVYGHACYCHHTAEDAPRKCPIWKYALPWERGEWDDDKCPFFESANSPLVTNKERT